MVIAAISARYNWGDKNTVDSLLSRNFDLDLSVVYLSNASAAEIFIYYSNGVIMVEKNCPHVKLYNLTKPSH